MILLLVLREKQTYGAALVRLYIESFEKEITLPAVVMVLKRLEKKGLLKSFTAEPTQQRGGRRKVMYEATALGFSTAEEAMEAKNQIWNVIPKAQ